VLLVLVASMYKSVPQVYRDCLRLIEHLAGRSRKADNMRTLVAKQFRANAGEKDDKKIEGMKKKSVDRQTATGACGGLANVAQCREIAMQRRSSPAFDCSPVAVFSAITGLANYLTIESLGSVLPASPPICSRTPLSAHSRLAYTMTKHLRTPS
jgi:hypothetical protein